MGLFDWFRGREPWRLENPGDDPEASRLLLALEKGDYKTVEIFFRGLTDPDAREFYVGEVAQWHERQFFDNWVNAAPDCADAWLLRGAHGVKWAWEARTSKRAAQVPEEAWPIFFTRLEQVWSDLQRAIELNPQDPIPYSEQIHCAIGLQLEKPIVMDCFEKARQRAPEQWEPHVRTLFYLCRKWHGSHEEMFDFAHAVSRSARVGSGLHALVAVAHIERWLYAFSFDNDVEYAKEHWLQRGVRDDVLKAYRRSLGARQFQPTRAARWQCNFFAFALIRIGAAELAMQEFNRIGDRPTGLPWSFLGDSLEWYSRYRDVARENL